jgi:hypothetical protein
MVLCVFRLSTSGMIRPTIAAWAGEVCDAKLIRDLMRGTFHMLFVDPMARAVA